MTKKAAASSMTSLGLRNIGTPTHMSTAFASKGDIASDTGSGKTTLDNTSRENVKQTEASFINHSDLTNRDTNCTEDYGEMRQKASENQNANQTKHDNIRTIDGAVQQQSNELNASNETSVNQPEKVRELDLESGKA